MRVFLGSLALVIVTAICLVAACAQTSVTTTAFGQTMGEASSESEASSQTSKASTSEESAPARRGTGRSAKEELTVAVVSDLNGSYGSTTYKPAVHSAVEWLTGDVQPDLVVSTGDMVAGQREGLDYSAMWDAFHHSVTRPLRDAGIPLAVTPGNHDASAGKVFMPERIQFVKEWMAHKPDITFVDDSFYPLYYAFEAGPALFISLDATVTGPIDEQQRRWLEELLEENRDKAVKVVFGHVPLYPFSEERESEVLADRRLERLLNDHDVDLMLSGHHHAYYPGRRGDLRLVGMACLGSGRRTLMGNEEPGPKSVAVIRLNGEGVTSVEAYTGEDFGRPVDRAALPRYLNGEPWRIWRDDVAPVRSRRQTENTIH